MPRIKPAAPRETWRRALPVVALLVGLGLFLLLVIEVGKFTRAQISDQDRYMLDFAAMECPAPPAEKRAEFLAEVQSLGNLPSRLHLLDEALPRQLADAFARHPYVEKVERIAVLPSHEISVKLSYRVPVLEVMLSVTDQARSKSDLADDPSWFVDGKGIVLPRRKLNDPLPLLLVDKAPTAKPGEPWGAREVESAARTAAFLSSHQASLHLRIFEIKSGDLKLSTPGGTRVLWGQAPGEEADGEAKASAKLDRLLNYCKQNGGLEPSRDRYEHDVRPLKEAVHRSLNRDN